MQPQAPGFMSREDRRLHQPVIQAFRDLYEKHGGICAPARLIALDQVTPGGLYARGVIPEGAVYVDSRIPPLAWLEHRRGTVGERYGLSERIPGVDHTVYYVEKDGTRVVLTQPYGLMMRDLRELMAYAESHSLEVHISASSGHYPGATLGVHIKVAKVPHTPTS